MHLPSRSVPALAALWLLAFAGSVSAGPVQADDAGSAGPAPVASPAWSDRPAAEGRTAPTLASPAAPSGALQADPAASASALAAQMIEEAGAGTQATEPPHGVPRTKAQTTPPRPAARSQADADPNTWGLRETAKAAVHWLKDTLPWLRGDVHEASTHRADALEPNDWSAPHLDGSVPGRGARVGSTPPAGAGRGAPPDPTLEAGYKAPTSPAAPDPERNILHLAVTLASEVFGHPMTWLVLSLFVIGAIAVKKLDRRPTK